MIQRLPKLLAIIAGLAVVAAAAQPALAQKSSERFIPIGQSPGLSGSVTLLGSVRAMDVASGQLTIALDGGGHQTIQVNPQTRLWLDRSEARAPSTTCEKSDLRPGVRVEAMPDKSTPGLAEWVKVNTP